MLVTFKTITQQIFKYELDPTTTIADVKKKLCEENGEAVFAVDSQKLIYNGKILQDEETLQQISFDEAKFIVVMVSKKKVETPAQTASSSAAESSTTTTTATAELAKTSNPATATVSAASVALEMPAEHLQTVNMIQGMGYPRDDVIRALKAAFYDPDRCVEYLCTGIPANLQSDFAPAAGSQPEDEDDDDELGFNLEFLQHNPQFQQIRELVRTHPETLPQIIQQIAGTNPGLMESIRRNQDAFLEMLNAEPSDVGVAAGSGASAVGGGGQNAPPGAVTIAITESDRNAIQRLKALGFAEQLVIEAYFACDKNEDLAANYILARMDEFNADS